MTETLLRDESITMFFAGHETTARTMAAAWYVLGTHPKSLRGCTRSSTPSSETMHRLSRNCITSPTRFRS